MEVFGAMVLENITYGLIIVTIKEIMVQQQ